MPWPIGSVRPSTSWGVCRAPFVVILGAVAALEAVGVAVWCFAKNPQCIDAWVQYFQARIFLSGALIAPVPPSIPHFVTLHTLTTERGWFSQYPPIHPALLAAGMAVGTPWLVTPVLAALLPGAVYLLARRTDDERVARVAATLVLLSPFVIAMDASAMNHLPAALCVAFGLWAVPAAARGRVPGGAVLGAASGLLLGLRPLDGAVLALVAAAGVLPALRHRRGWTMLLATTGAGLATLLPTLAFNAAATGNPFQFGYSALYGRGLQLGFHPGPWGAALTPLRALGYTALDAHQLNVYALEWPLPVTALVAAGLWLRRGRLDDGLRLSAGYLLALVGALFFYFHRDTLYGPRFLFSAMPSLFVLLASTLVQLAHVKRPLGWRGVTGGDVSLVGAVTVGLLAAAALAPRRLASYGTNGTGLALHPDDDARRAGIARAVVVMPDGWGTRLIARLWGAGVSMSEADRLYHAFDACTLEERLSAAEKHGLRGRGLTALLTRKMRGADAGRPIPGLTRDLQLRLPASGRVTRRCAEEIARDQRGTVQFSQFSYLNTPALDGDIVWAREMGAADALLRRLYPDRDIYRYTVPTPRVGPTFTRLATAVADAQRAPTARDRPL